MMEHLRKLAPTAQAGPARAQPLVRARGATPGPLRSATAAAAMGEAAGVSGDRRDASDASVAPLAVDRRQAGDGWLHPEALGRFPKGSGDGASRAEHGGRGSRDGLGRARASGAAQASPDTSSRRGMHDDDWSGRNGEPAFMPRGGVAVHGTDGSGMRDGGLNTDSIPAQAFRAASFVAPVSIEALAARRPAMPGPTVVHVEIDRIDLRLPAAATPSTTGGKAAPRGSAAELTEWLRRGRAPQGGRP